LALVDMSVAEQRYRAVLAVQAGETAVAVAAQFGVSRQSVQNWLRRYRDDGLAGLIDQPKRPDTSPGQTSVEVEALICEMRREHPRWGARRIAHELAATGVAAVPSRTTVASGPGAPRPGPAPAPPPRPLLLPTLGTRHSDGVVAARHRRRHPGP
jgi:transposase